MLTLCFQKVHVQLLPYKIKKIFFHRHNTMLRIEVKNSAVLVRWSRWWARGSSPSAVARRTSSSTPLPPRYTVHHTRHSRIAEPSSLPQVPEDIIFLIFKTFNEMSEITFNTCIDSSYFNFSLLSV